MSGKLTAEASWHDVFVGNMFIGDMDGDTTPDVLDPSAPIQGIRLSSTGELQDFPGHELAPEWPRSVGDLDRDGFDELMIGRRDWVSRETGYCFLEFGPGQLVRGSASGMVPEALWEITATGYPLTGVGRFVTRIGQTDTLVATIVEEGFLCYGDWAPGYLGVIHEAGTPAARLDQVVPVEQLYEGYQMPRLLGLLDGRVVLAEPTRLQWFTWDEVTESLVAEPDLWTPAERTFDDHPGFIAAPPGLRHQALALGSYRRDDDQFELLVWGRSVEEVGPPLEGWTDGTCTFWSAPYGEPSPPSTSGPIPRPDPEPETPPVVVQPDPRACGCGSAPSSAGTLVLLGGALFAGRRGTITAAERPTACRAPARCPRRRGSGSARHRARPGRTGAG